MNRKQNYNRVTSCRVNLGSRFRSTEEKVLNIDWRQQGKLHSKGVGANTLEGEELIYRGFGGFKAL